MTFLSHFCTELSTDVRYALPYVLKVRLVQCTQCYTTGVISNLIIPLAVFYVSEGNYVRMKVSIFMDYQHCFKGNKAHTYWVGRYLCKHLI